MTKFSKAFSTLLLVFILLLTMTSCSGYDFYNDWHGAGADIDKENIYEVISLEEAKKKKDASETFVLVYAASSSSKAVSVITSLQAQAEYLSCTDVVIYYLNSKDYFGSTSTRTEVRNTLNMNESPSDGSPVILGFKSGATILDTSDSKKSKDFMVDGSISYSSLASYIFRDLLAK